MTETRKLIQETFLDLARSRLPRKITVTDIVNACQINRNSFYYYFDDLPDMIECTVAEMMDEAIKKENPQDLGELIAIVQRCMQENRNVCLYLYRTPAKNELAHYYRRTGNHIVQTYLDQVNYYGMTLTEQEKSGVLRFYKNILTGLLEDWLTLNMADDMVDHYREMMTWGLNIIRYKHNL